jgi:hypothetical protein
MWHLCERAQVTEADGPEILTFLIPQPDMNEEITHFVLSWVCERAEIAHLGK